MKKITLLAFTLLSACAFAQKSFFGVDAGVNFANQRIVSKVISNGVVELDGVGFQRNKVKPTFGIFYHRQLSETIGIRLNVQYMGQGYNNSGNSGMNVDINYLTLPLTFHYATTKYLSFNAGPYVSFTLDGTKINNQDITKTYHKNDFGFILGGEHHLYKNFSIGVSYIIGLKNIWLADTTTSLPGVTISSKYTNRALQFTLTYKLKKNQQTL
jgi:hypothetical protein